MRRADKLGPWIMRTGKPLIRIGPQLAARVPASPHLDLWPHPQYIAATLQPAR